MDVCTKYGKLFHLINGLVHGIPSQACIRAVLSVPICFGLGYLMPRGKGPRAWPC